MRNSKKVVSTNEKLYLKKISLEIFKKLSRHSSRMKLSGKINRPSRLKKCCEIFSRLNQLIKQLHNRLFIILLYSIKETLSTYSILFKKTFSFKFLKINLYQKKVEKLLELSVFIGQIQTATCTFDTRQRQSYCISNQ